MYDIKTINRALKLLDKYDNQFTKKSRELGIRLTALRSWYNKRKNNVSLLLGRQNKKSKWSDEYKSNVLNYYFDHGENAMKTYKKFGEPSYSTLKFWISKTLFQVFLIKLIEIDKRIQKNIEINC